MEARGRQVLVDRPDRRCREAVCRVHLKKVTLDPVGVAGLERRQGVPGEKERRTAAPHELVARYGMAPEPGPHVYERRGGARGRDCVNTAAVRPHTRCGSVIIRASTASSQVPIGRRATHRTGQAGT